MEIIIFAATLVAFCIIGFAAIKSLACSQQQISNNILSNAAYICEFFLLVVSLLGSLNILPLKNISGICTTFAVAGVIAVLTINLRIRHRSDTASNQFVFLAKTLFAVIMVECLLFNMPSLHMLGEDCSTKKIHIRSSQTINFTSTSNGYITTSSGVNKPVINIKNVNAPVETLMFDIEFPENTPYVDIDVEFSDSTNSVALRAVGAQKRVIKGVENSKYMQCEFSGDVKDLKLYFNLKSGQSVTLKQIVSNEQIPFDFSFLRVTVFTLAAVGLYALLNAKKLKRPTTKSFAPLKRAAYIATAVFMTFAILIVVLRQGTNFKTLKSDFTATSGNQITQELVDAFKKGHVNLDVVPDSNLTSLENPYDWSVRNQSKANVSWDHVLYNGKYYSYYGIAPVLLLFLPYNLLTKFYFPTHWAVLIFSLIGMWFLTKTYLALMRQKFPKIPFNLAFAGLLLIQITSGIWFSVARPFFYEISISSGFACVTAGAFFLISSNILRDKNISLARLTASSVLLALGVLCRPTTAVFCIAAVVFILFGFAKQRKQNPSLCTDYLICAFLPFILLGSVQMIYNYMRFGSALDFGIQYSLTINDFTNSQFHLKFVLMTVFAYLFAAPYFVPQFPYVTSSFQKLSTNGYYFIDDAPVNGLSIGLFAKALPMFGYLGIRRAYRLMPQKTRRRDMLLLVLTCIVAPLIIMFSVWESGFAARYNADICWVMLTGALCIIYVLFEHENVPKIKRLYEIFFAVSIVVACVICFAQIYNFFENACTATVPQTVMNYINYVFSIFKR